MSRPLGNELSDDIWMGLHEVGPSWWGGGFLPGKDLGLNPRNVAGLAPFDILDCKEALL